MKLYVLFVGKGTWGIGWPYIGYDEEKLCKSILKRLEKTFPQIEFIGGKIVSKYDLKELWEIKQGIRGSDGLLIYIVGNYGTNPMIDSIGVEAIKIGKPTILASYMYGGDWGFIRMYERIRGKGFPVLPIASSNFNDVEKAIRIMEGLYRMRGKKILIFTFDKAEIVKSEEDNKRLLRELSMFKERLGGAVMKGFMKILSNNRVKVDVHGIDQAIQWKRDEDKYREILKKIFGLEMIRLNPEKLNEYYEKIDVEDAKRVAEKWIKEAEKIEVSHQSIVNSARLYLALKKLIKDTGCDAIGIECCPVILSGKMPVYPCMAFSKLNDEGIIATCEADMDSAVTLFFGKYVINRPGMMGNYALDIPHNRITYLHCTSPTRLHGYNNPPLKYYITTHGESHFLGVSPVIRFPSGEDVTTIKISVFHRKICIRYGKSLGLIEDEKACRDKLAVETNAVKILEKHNQEIFGWHKVSFLGDFREEFKAAAKLLGLEIVEET